MWLNRMLIAAALLAALALDATASARPQRLAVGAAGGCDAAVVHGVLPSWARAGFSDPRPRMPYELGRAGKIAAILWADPLRSPPPQDHNNKILWVSRTIPSAPTALWIHAQRMTGSHAVGLPVTRVVKGGPGPSIIDLPAAGCWRLSLAWSGRTDTLDLQYAP